MESNDVKTRDVKATAFPPWMPGQFEYEGKQFAGVFSAEIYEQMKTFKYQDTDIIVATYPKSGTNWMAEIVYLISRDTDLELARTSPLHDRIYFIDLGKSTKEAWASIDKLPTAAPPRVITTHQVRSIFKKPLEETQAKFVIVIRNVKDILVSYYNFSRAHIAYKFKGSFDDYYELFKHDQINQGNWCDWLLDWWQEKDNPNVLFVMYENMIKDLPTEVGRVAAFMGKTLSDDEKRNLCEYVTFNSMRENKDKFGKPKDMDNEISHFFRKGQVGDWKNYFSKEQSDYVDSMYEERVKSAGITVQFE